MPTSPPASTIGNLAKPEAFFYKHAGWNHDPKTETDDQGRKRCAAGLAQAEAHARYEGWRYSWQHETDGEDRSGINHDGPLWLCILYDNDGEVMDSLGNIDLGATGHPCTEPHGRVCEAELALEHMP